MSLSRSAIDRLGDRLRADADLEEGDLRLLDAYRREFAESYEQAVSTLRTACGVQPTGRPAKSTASIVEKLRRESVRLSQLQDIAGCRILAKNRHQQDDFVARMAAAFVDVAIVDRRERPSHGYRAVHVLVTFEHRLVEVQVRTQLQHLWAEVSEKFADRLGQIVKYGGGDPRVRGLLDRLSELIRRNEEDEWISHNTNDPRRNRQSARGATKRALATKRQIRELLEDVLSQLDQPELLTSIMQEPRQ